MSTDSNVKMKPAQTEPTLLDVIRELGPAFRERAADHDERETFVADNYASMKEKRFFAAAIPKELGGGGVSHPEMCDVLRVMAHYCSSTALAHSMHQHLLAANIWKYRKGKGAEEMLRKVAQNQPVLVSTGARDWLESNGTMKRAEGGFLVSGTKAFASQSAQGDILITSAPYQDPDRGWLVHHFPVPFSTKGVTVLSDWHTMGMRGTGSNSVVLEDAFVPDSAIVLTRPRGEFHSFFNVVATAAMPLIMAVYLGVAERASEIALTAVRMRKQGGNATYLAATMNNHLLAASVQHGEMVRIANNLDFEPVMQNSHRIFTLKTNVANECIATVTAAMELVGGQGFYRTMGLERLFRDVQGAKYHPMQEMDQLLFSGNFLLNGASEF